MVGVLGVDVEEALAGRAVRRAEPHVQRLEDLAVDDPAQRLAGLVDAQHPAGLAAGVERAGLVAARRSATSPRGVGALVIACSRSRVRWSTSPVTGISRLAWKPRTASTVVGVVAAGDVAEQPLDRHQPGLQVADLVAAVAGAEDRRAGVEDVEELVVGGRLRHRDQTRQVRWSTTPVALKPRLAWKPLTAVPRSRRRSARSWSRGATPAGRAAAGARAPAPRSPRARAPSRGSGVGRGRRASASAVRCEGAAGACGGVVVGTGGAGARLGRGGAGRSS